MNPSVNCPACGTPMHDMKCAQATCEMNQKMPQWEANVDDLSGRTALEWAALLRLSHGDVVRVRALQDSGGVFDKDRKYTVADFTARVAGLLAETS